MNVGIDRKTTLSPLLQDLSRGLVSGLLYLSYLLSFIFLIPLQTVFTSRGWKSGWAAALASALTVAIGLGIRLAGMGGFAFSSLAASCAPPILVIAALGLVNAKPGRLGKAARIALAAGLLSAAAAPFVFKIILDPDFGRAMIAFVESALGESGMEIGSGAQVDDAVRSALGVLGSGFSAMIFGLLGFSWWMGTNIALRSRYLALADEERMARLRSVSLRNYKVHPALLWPSLASWALLFAVLAAKGTPILTAIAWNIALFLACPYAAQGLGILGFIQEAYPAARFIRLLGPLAVILLALSPAVGTIILIGLPLLGITEVWIPYRTLKGALK